jgi:hypothetical protein
MTKAQAIQRLQQRYTILQVLNIKTLPDSTPAVQKQSYTVLLKDDYDRIQQRTFTLTTVDVEGVETCYITGADISEIPNALKAKLQNEFLFVRDLSYNEKEVSATFTGFKNDAVNNVFTEGRYLAAIVDGTLTIQRLVNLDSDNGLV